MVIILDIRIFNTLAHKIIATKMSHFIRQNRHSMRVQTHLCSCLQAAYHPSIQQIKSLQ